MEDMTFVSRQRLCDLDRETVLSTHSGCTPLYNDELLENL